jgi:sulfate permease, SulP family
VIDLETCFEIDVTGVDALLRVAQVLDEQDIALHLARAKAPVRAILERTGAAITIKTDHLRAAVDSAVDAAERTS